MDFENRRNGTELFSALLLNFRMHVPQQTRRLGVMPQGESWSSVIVQNGARVYNVPNACGIFFSLKNIGRHYMTEIFHFYQGIQYFVK